MTDIEEWINANQARLEAISRTTRTPLDFVHLVAVLVKAGQSDEEIVHECEALRPRVGTEVFDKGLHRVLSRIRELPDDTQAAVGTRP
jgi:hypothetical protein